MFAFVVVAVAIAFMVLFLKCLDWFFEKTGKDQNIFCLGASLFLVMWIASVATSATVAMLRSGY